MSLPPSLRREIEPLLLDSSGAPSPIVSVAPQGGGCINRAFVLRTEDGTRFFLKSNEGALPGLFEREAEGLEALGAVDALRVPRVLGVGPAEQPFLLLEAIATGPRPGGFSEEFGRAFARLHRESQDDRSGFPHDNYIGSTPQPNTWTETWPEFFRRHRLGYQIHLARQRGLSTRALDRSMDSLLDRLDELLDVPGEVACLLHGDLWGGNYLVDDRGQAVLIDPATYYGHREADLAMTRLFGGFDGLFYAAYEEEWPLPPSASERLEIYQLYHLLNHLNLFGRGYLDQCLGIARRYG